MDYKKQAEDFCNKYGVFVFIKKSSIQTAPNWAKEGENHGTKYDVKIGRMREGLKREFLTSEDVQKLDGFTFNFWGSIADKENRKKPTAYSVLACIQKYDVGTLWDFIGNFGYEANEEAQRIYNAVRKEWEKVNSFFSAEELEELREVQ